MKSKIVLTSAAALMLSVAGANAWEYKPFVGATIGLQGARYSDAAEEMERVARFDFPTDFFVFGLETGMRIGSYFDIYNGGVTLSATKTTYSNGQKKYVDETFVRMDAFNISLTYDNYIRISGDKENRIDLVVGAGFGTMATHTDVISADSETKWSFAPEFKLGLDFELAEHVILFANFRTIFPTRPHYEMDMSYIVGGGVRYIF